MCYDVSIEISIYCVPLALAHSVAFLSYDYYETRKYRSVEVIYSQAMYILVPLQLILGILFAILFNIVYKEYVSKEFLVFVTIW